MNDGTRQLEYLDGGLAPKYKEAGFEILASGLLSAPQWNQMPTSWAKRLRNDHERSALYLVARAIEFE